MATLANDRVDLARYQTLAQQNAISNQQLLTQSAKVKSDEGVVVSDKANVDAARINLNYTRILSPIDGKTGLIFIQPGNVVFPRSAPRRSRWSRSPRFSPSRYRSCCRRTAFP